jgi:hypothetical protein|tara:strand:+ start:77 stop:295 length:219 start_codon:yes stop_codon:yes gene_type:complete
MTLKEIVTELEILEGQLDDAFYQIPEYDCNSDGRSYVDGARSDLYVLKDNLEKAVLNGAEVTVPYEDVKAEA